MNIKTMTMLATVVLAAVSVEAVSWKNIDNEHHLAGRKSSEGYMQGKVVMVARWGLKNEASREVLPRTEEIWKSYKSKQFVAIAAHKGGWGGAEGVKALATEQGFTMPIYEDAALVEGEPKTDELPLFYIVDETGKVVFTGKNDRDALQALVIALTDLGAPKNLEQWKRFLDFELEHLPGQAVLRAKEFRRKFPAEAKAYEPKLKELAANKEIKKLVELVELAKKYKDHQSFSDKQKIAKLKLEKQIKSALSKYASLKESTDPKIAQEAKNALADLKWTAAEL